MNTATNAFHVREVALPYARNGYGHLSRGLRVQAIKPSGVRAAAVRVEEFKDLKHMQ